MGLLSSIFKRPEAQSGASYRDGVSDELVEQTRTRARNRLIGALVLVIAGVVALPMLFDSEPRPLPGNTRIEVAKAGTAEPAAAPSKSSAPKVIDESLADAGAPVARPAPAPAAANGVHVSLLPHPRPRRARRRRTTPPPSPPLKLRRPASPAARRRCRRSPTSKSKPETCGQPPRGSRPRQAHAAQDPGRRVVLGRPRPCPARRP